MFQNSMVLQSDIITVPLEPLQCFFVESNYAHNVQYGMCPCYLNISTVG